MSSRTVGPYPTQHYVHLVSIESRPLRNEVRKTFHTYPIDIQRPERGYRVEALECGTCGQPLAFTVLSIQSTKRACARWAGLILLGMSALNRVIDEGLLSFRCDAAPMITGWPVSATFRATVPPEQLDRTACALARLPEIRLCAAVTGF